MTSLTRKPALCRLSAYGCIRVNANEVLAISRHLSGKEVHLYVFTSDGSKFYFWSGLLAQTDEALAAAQYAEDQINKALYGAPSPSPYRKDPTP